MYRIIQITDLHIGREGERPRDIDVRGNFEAVIREVKAERPDFVVLSGDLSFHDGDRGPYRYVRARIESLGCPYAVISGNHDISLHLAEEFDLKDHLRDGELYYTREGIGGRSLILLDSAPGNMTDAQLEWLDRTVRSFDAEGRRAIVFVHHPPLLCDCRYMDTHYPFTRSDVLVPILESFEGLDAVYCGHYHAEAVKPLPGRSNVAVHVTPSVWFQIDRESDQMRISDTRPGYRVIDIDEVDHDDRAVTSAVRYVDSGR